MSKIHTVKALVKFCKVNKAESKQSLSFCLDSDSANKLLIEYKTLKDVIPGLISCIKPLDKEKVSFENFDFDKYTYMFSSSNRLENIRVQDPTGKEMSLEDISSGDEVLIQVSFYQSQYQNKKYFSSNLVKVVKIVNSKYKYLQHTTEEIAAADDELNALLSVEEVTFADDSIDLD